MQHTNILLESGTNELEVIEFTLEYPLETGEIASQSFGINVIKVREIIRMPDLTEFPNMPRAVKGVFNLRNSIIPAVDLNEWLYSTPNTADDRKLIVAEFNNLKTGFIVNQVRRIHRFSWQQVEPPDVIHDFDMQSSTVIGIIKTDTTNILMVDVEKIVAEINPKLGMEHVDVKPDEDAHSINVLTAEDSPTIRKMILDRLRVANYNVHAFNDGQSAWNYLETVQKRVLAGEDIRKILNIVITDIEMPQMDGLALTKRIKLTPQLQHLPVIVFSSIISEDVSHKGRSVGADAQLTKPKIGLLLDTIRELLIKSGQITPR
jgi:two-component system chemotaxis response regulator CheV